MCIKGKYALDTHNRKRCGVGAGEVMAHRTGWLYRALKLRKLDARRCCSGVDFCMKSDEAGWIRDKAAKLRSRFGGLIVGYMLLGCDNAKLLVVTENCKNDVAYLVHSHPKGNHFWLRFALGKVAIP